jgi:hypothetical protein
MTVIYPGKFRNQLTAQAILDRVVDQRDAHMVVLNRYRFNEQHSCKDLTDLIEKLDGQPKDLVRELSHHVADEARHAYWLGDLLYELGVELGTPPGMSYISEFEQLLDYNGANDKENTVIDGITAINVTEKRGCEYFAAHIRALKKAEQTPENIKIRETIEKIMPEEVEHVKWGNRKLAEIAKSSPENRAKVEQAKRKYAAIEQAALEYSMDILAGAEVRRLDHLRKIVETLPIWQRPQYLAEHFGNAIFNGELQKTRFEFAQKAWQKDPNAFFEKFVPMFFAENLKNK